MLEANESGGEGDSGASSASPSGNEPDRAVPASCVRYGLMNHLGEFTHKSGARELCYKQVVIQTDRGIEMGTHVACISPDGSKAVPRQQVADYLNNSGPECLRLNAGRILRQAGSDDILEEKRLTALAAQRMDFCRQAVARHNLPMKLVTCENLLGGERIIFYFLADGRIDFRDLVKDLATEFQTRIEMRQIGARDEARLVADYETCGRECCCKNFLKTLKPVSMKMAKMQKATLDPSKVSGRCGRLKCCLRYEHQTYDELDKNLPRIGARINTAQGAGTVVDRQILTQLVQINTEDDRTLTVSADEILDPDSRKADNRPSSG